MTHLLATLLLLTAPAAAQTVGGGYETLYQWDGGTADDKFGYSVSGAGDINQDGFYDLIVGTKYTSPGGLTEAGSAFAYSGADGSLLYRWDGRNAGDLFGGSVSEAGDVNGDGFADVIVGAQGVDTGNILDTGSAFVYSGADGSLLHQWNGAATLDWFGNSVSGTGDINSDGFDDLVVGAHGADPGASSYAGSVYVYSGATGSLLQQWNGSVGYGYFGSSVHGAGDVNGDGFNDVIVGAPGVGHGTVGDAGSAFVYSGSDGTLLYQWDGQLTGENLGISVSDAGDVNRDGFDDFLIGALAGGKSNGWVGTAYVYSGMDGLLLYQWDGVLGDHFGSSVSSAGDVDGDGTNDLIVGAKFASHGGLSLAGSAYVYSGANGSLLQRLDGGAAYDYFGSSVSDAGNVNGDGLDDLIISAHYADPMGLSNAGSVYVYSFNPFMRANTSSISASAGGVLNLNLDFPGAAGFDEYKILISESGVGPTRYGVDIPLTLDSLVLDTYSGIYPVPVYNDLHGTLDANGDASGSLTVPAGIPSALIGNTYYFAAIANQIGQLPEFSSVAIPISITP
jgi:FG-GAP repeat protein